MSATRGEVVTEDPTPEQSLLVDRRNIGDPVFKGISVGSGMLILAILAAVAAFLIIQAVPAFLTDAADLKYGNTWGYVAPFLFGTIWSSFLALLMAVPVAVGIALYISHFAPKQLAAPVAFIVDLLAAVPSVVFGLWGINVLAPALVPIYQWLGANLGWIPLFGGKVSGTGRTMLTAAIVLAIMILPIITAISREVFNQVPTPHKEGALALGATKWEMIRTAVLPFGKPGVISGAMLGLGRALGETLAVMILLSTLNPSAPWSFSIFNGGETFASKIALNAGEFDSPQKTGAYIAAGLVLFILTFIVNSIARVVINRRKAFSE